MTSPPTVRSAFAATFAIAVLAIVLRAPAASAQGCPAPTSLTARSECTGVRLAWLGARLGTGWRILRAAPHSAGIAIATVTANTFLDTTAQPGVLYEYGVQQFGGACGTTSPFAGPAEGMNGTPAPVTGITAADEASCVFVRVTWNANPDAVNYDVWRSPTEDGGDGNVIATTALTSYDDTTAAHGLPYWYWVRARSTVSCLGPFADEEDGEPGRLIAPKYPDLTLDPTDSLQFRQFDFPDGRPCLLVAAGVVNLGTTTFHITVKNGNIDGSWDYFQRTIECGNTKDYYLGRFLTPRPPGFPNTVPDFVRVRLRHRFPNGAAGLEAAHVDIPALCVNDFIAYDTTLVGAPNDRFYRDCNEGDRGISIGWKSYVPPISLDFAMDLNCVTDGLYYLEREVDPENRYVELDETNNFERIPIELTGLGSVAGPDCMHPNMSARLLGPDSLVVAVGAATDTLRVRVWAGDRTEPEGPPTFANFAKVGCFVREDIHNRLGPEPVASWFPAQWRRQIGSEDEFVATVTVPAPGEYLYTFSFLDDDGRELWADLDGSENGTDFALLGKVRAQTTTAVEPAGPAAALSFSLVANPAHGPARFALQLPASTSARITIYDVLGHRLRALETGTLSAGPRVVEWDGRREDGASAPAGVYWARLVTAAGERRSAKFVLARR